MINDLNLFINRNCPFFCNYLTLKQNAPAGSINIINTPSHVIIRMKCDNDFLSELPDEIFLGPREDRLMILEVGPGEFDLSKNVLEYSTKQLKPLKVLQFPYTVALATTIYKLQ
eukprot:Awhi_evm1s3029